MPDTFIRFSDMKDSHPSPIDGANDLLAIAHKDINSSTGYNSMTVTPNALGSHAVEDQTFVNLETGAKTVEGAINQTLGNFANKYDQTQQYAVDDCVLYAGTLYKCVVAISTPEAWNSTHWEQIKAIDVGSGGGGGSSADHITLTQAEYDALVHAGTVDPNAFYFIKDTNGDGQKFQPVIYSLEEREIGVWTDGKPLYQKTFAIQIKTTVYDIDVTALNIDTLFFVNNATYKKATADNNVVYLGYFSSNEDKFQAYYKYSAKLIRIALVGSGFVGTGHLTIRYTKTTDTAGSGTWTPQGVPAVHYSTDEQVVGTWVDGSTLYEKTINFGALPNNTEKSVAHNISNVDKIWISDGFVFTSSNTFYGLVHTAGSSQTMQYAWDTNVDRTNVTIETYSDRSTLLAYITVRYTKTSA